MNSNNINQYQDTDQQIIEIEKVYNKINNDWLKLHYLITIGLVMFSFVVECILGVIMMNSDMLSTTVQRFIIKFVIVPSGINLLLLAINSMVIHSKHLTQRKKIYTISLNFVFICFVLFTAHNAFTATYYVFAVAIILTTIYASYKLTSITAVTSILALVISELFVPWDVDKISVYESTLRLGDFLIAIFVLLAFSIVCMVLIRYEQRKNMASIQLQIERHRLEKSLQVDDLTGIMNRKSLFHALKNLEESGDFNYILAITDIDNFKRINDTLGHAFGDHCLIQFANILKENSVGAVPYRFGGDEFCLLFHNVDIEEAIAVCKLIQLKLNEIHIEEQETLKLTASFGLAKFTDKIDSTELFVHSDHALYEAKVKRNNICVYQKKASR